MAINFSMGALEKSLKDLPSLIESFKKAHPESSKPSFRVLINKKDDFGNPILWKRNVVDAQEIIENSGYEIVDLIDNENIYYMTLGEKQNA